MHLFKYITILDNTAFFPVFNRHIGNIILRKLHLHKVTDDILKTLDSHNDVVLVMLDLFAAFDTLDHTLVERLRSYFGFSGTALQWFSSYLRGRSQKVIIGDTISSPRYLEFGSSWRYFRLRNVLTNVSLERFVWADVHKTLLAKAWSIAVFVHW